MEVAPAVKHSALALAPTLETPSRAMIAAQDPLGGGLARYSSPWGGTHQAHRGDDEATKIGV